MALQQFNYIFDLIFLKQFYWKPQQTMVWSSASSIHRLFFHEQLLHWHSCKYGQSFIKPGTQTYLSIQSFYFSPWIMNYAFTRSANDTDKWIMTPKENTSCNLSRILQPKIALYTLRIFELFCWHKILSKYL